MERHYGLTERPPPAGIFGFLGSTEPSPPVTAAHVDKRIGDLAGLMIDVLATSIDAALDEAFRRRCATGTSRRKIV